MSKTITNELVSTETIYTTIIASPTPTIYNASNTDLPAHQQQSQSASNMNDPNNNNGLEESLKSDQQALKRMIMILSLVGGLGVVAIVTTVVIFTRMRAKNKKNRECIDDDQHDNSTIALSLDNHNDDDDSTPSVNHVSLSDQPTTIEPSAPPATILNEDTETPYYDNRRHFVSMMSQTTAIPSPSAPTAKELDAAVDDRPSIPSTSGHHRHRSACTRCLPEILPELPPPAYTPSAPPHYALPVEAVAMDNLLPSRRYSLGA
ncbi:uncharacterized protein B0P05DRAFT_526885 [Gilbertella persicaria]|uniref:Uncharacterized protein n=1 Tax=Rhizopus stolonifer TaxID=4846 RepID=A0A367JUY0_RHIST|nr:uncharacterized protein B0P05DRAFT_526885 [Gilbertella persicaria]KAI8091292.1 hypothetical protein B0P05DRAFT_526885 [Gilbertella persicaria]RCH93659.1 hypothetical protein CU098_003925 [Rhizopus stolonifer]